MANRSSGIETSGPKPVLKTGHIGVVTVTYNSGRVLPDFFESLASQTCREYTLYVVDNSSKDETLERCRKRADLPIVLLVNDTNLGVAEGNNQGIRAALADGCEFVLLLNNDTVFDPQLFVELRDGLHKQACAMVTPKILYHDHPDTIWAAGGRFQRWLGSRAVHYGEGKLDVGQFDKVRRISYAPTCCVLIDRRVFDQVGLMDPVYFVYGDDNDFMYRTMQAGLRIVYLPNCRLLHKVSSLTGGGSSPFLIRFCTRNRVYFSFKHLPRVSATFWIATYRVYLLLRFILRRDTLAAYRWKEKAIAEGISLWRRELHCNRGPICRYSQRPG